MAIGRWVRSRRGLVLGTLTAGAVLLAGCSSKTTNTSTGGASTGVPPVSATSPASSPAPQGQAATTGGSVKVRVVNLLGVPIDVYAQDPRQGGPVIRNLATGQASDYVAPPTLDQGANLEPFKVGSTDRTDFGGIAQGFTAHTTITDIFFPTTDPDGTKNFASHMVNDSGPLQDSSGNVATPPAGLGIIVADGNALTASGSGVSGYLEIDGSCVTAITDTGNSSKTPTFLTNGDNAYPVSPGSHQLSALIFGATPPSSCAGQTAGGTAGVSVDAGKRVDVVVSGTTSQDAKLLVLPVP